MAVVHGMERALPGLRLEWTVTDEHYPVMISGMELPARSGPSGQALFEALAEIPLDATGLAAAADVLEATAEGALAF